LKQCLEKFVFGMRAGNREDVVNMDSDENNPCVSTPEVHAPLARKTSEAPREHILMHLFTPNAPALLHAVDPLVEFPDPCRKTGTRHYIDYNSL
jgi:hypothetical protein